MKRFLTTSAALAIGLAATPTLAQDWDGFYAGLSASSVDGALSLVGTPFDFEGQDAAAIGFFAGYNRVLPSNLVIGGELTYSDVYTSDIPFAPYYGDGLLQVRARIGYSMGTVMPYAAVGAARTEVGLLGGPSTNETGWSLGLGAEFMVADQMSLRTEFSTVRFSNVGENVWLPPGAGDYSYDQFTIGLGWHF